MIDVSLFEFGFTHHRKVRRLSDAAFRLWVTAIDHANEDGSDGAIPRVDIDCYPHAPKTPEERDATIAELVKSGLWHETESGWEIHEFLQWQESAAERKRRKTNNPDQPSTPANIQPAPADTSSQLDNGWPKASQLGGVARASGASRTPAGRFQPRQLAGPADSSQPPAGSQPGGAACFPPHPLSDLPESRSKEERESGSPELPESKGSGRAKAARRTRLPDDWAPNEEHRTRASQLGLKLDAELEKFRAHAVATGRVMANWNATFTTWLLNAERWAPRGSQAPQGRAFESRGDRNPSDAEEERRRRRNSLLDDAKAGRYGEQIRKAAESGNNLRALIDKLETMPRPAGNVARDALKGASNVR